LSPVTASDGIHESDVTEDSTRMTFLLDRLLDDFSTTLPAR
jgi:hypothetical protein